MIFVFAHARNRLPEISFAEEDIIQKPDLFNCVQY